MTISGSRLPILSGQACVTFPAAQHRRLLAGTKLYCLVTEVYIGVNNLPKVVRLRPQYCSNNVEATTATFDFVATNGNNIERFYCKISSFRQSRNKLNMFDFFEVGAISSPYL